MTAKVKKIKPNRFLGVAKLMKEVKEPHLRRLGELLIEYNEKYPGAFRTLDDLVLEVYADWFVYIHLLEQTQNQIQKIMKDE